MWRALPALVLLAACAPSTSTGQHLAAASVAATPPVTAVSPTPPASAILGVFFNRTDGSLSMVDTNGVVVASTHASPPHRSSAGLPWTSASLKRVYYLDVASNVNYLLPDGSTGVATHISLNPGEEAGFAVSPDDRRIAVGVLGYSPSAPTTYLGMRIYVEDLSGGRNHVALFSSTGVAEFPIGWTGGHLIVAVSRPVCCETPPDNPYNPYIATAYHVVDADSGTRLVSLCGGSLGPIGPIEPIGVMCWTTDPGGPTFLHWDGSTFPAPTAAPVPWNGNAVVLSPNGTRIAYGGPHMPYVAVAGPNGGGADTRPYAGLVYGWLDASHVVYQSNDNGRVGILEVDTPANSYVPGTGVIAYLGPFPTPVS